MSAAEALHRAVVAHPDDDTPRLICADWLEEHGEPARAAFIRAQIEAARCDPWSPAARAADSAANALLDEHGPVWYPDWPESVKVTYHRGFVTGTTINAHGFLRVAETIFAAAPLRELGLARPWVSEDGAFCTSLAPCFTDGHLLQIRALELSGVHIAYDELYALSESGSLANLESLALPGNPIHPNWLAEMLAGDAFPALAALDLAHNAHLGPALVRGLEKARHRRFRALDLSGMTSLTSDLLQRLFGLPALKSLKELRLGWPGGSGRSGPMELLDMAWIVPWRNLRLLDLTGQQIGAQGVREIAESADAANLRWLSLAANGIGPDGVQWLLASRVLRLFHLDVRGNDLDRRLVAELRARFPEAIVLS